MVNSCFRGFIYVNLENKKATPMNMKKSLVYICLLGSTQGIFTAAGYIVPDSYANQKIGPDSIYDLVNQNYPLPKEARIKFDKWTAKPETAALLSELLRFKFISTQELRNKQAEDNQRIGQSGLENKSKANYVFRVPNMDYYVKIAGPGNRAQSALMERGVWPGQQPNSDILKEVLSGKIPTYQTASRAAYFLILKKLIKNKKLKHIDVQDTHLVFYPGVPEDVQDKYVLVLEKALPKTAQKLTSGDAKQLPNETLLKELVQAIIGAGLWSIIDNVYLDGETLRIVDLEQPNNSAPKDFFHKNKTRYDGNMTAGIEHLLDLLEGNSEKLQFVRTLIETDPVVSSPEYSQRYKRELMQLLDKKASKPVQSSKSESK